MNDSILDKDLILLKIAQDNQHDLLKNMADLLLDKGYVKDTFLENIYLREKRYPTGLDTGQIKVAIPHTDSEHVNKACICIATLEKPVKFNDMSDPENILDISLVLMLAVKDPSKQVPLLTKLMSIFSDQELLKDIYSSDNKDEIYEIIKNILVLEED